MSNDWDDSTVVIESSWNKPFRQQNKPDYQQSYRNNQGSNGRGGRGNRSYKDGGGSRSFRGSDNRSYGNQGDRSYVSHDDRQFGNRDNRSYGNRDDRSYGNHNDRFGNRDERTFGNQTERSYGNREERSYGNHDDRTFVNYNDRPYGNRDNKGFVEERDRSFRGGGERSSRWGEDRANGEDRERSEFGDKRHNSDEGHVIKIPSKFVGRVIGKGGSKISDLQFESGAVIKITKEVEGDETKVRIIGGEEEIKKAEELIMELTVERTQFDRPRYEFKPADTPATTTMSSTLANFDWKTLSESCDQAQKDVLKNLPPIKKIFYDELPEVANMTQEEVDKFREENNNIVVQYALVDDEQKKAGDKKDIPKPVKNFYQAFHNYPEILQEIKKAGFENPTPIQCQSWPILLSGGDLIGIAQTGTGKTLAFLLPALIHIDGQETKRDKKEPTVLIIAPTRELALQIEREVNKYEYRGIKAVCVYGGASRKDQIKIVTDGVDILIATPGRLNDLYYSGFLNLENITYVVLDEADRMLDMGFEPQIRKILYSIRGDRQTVLTSATWPLGVRRLAKSYCEHPIQVYVGSLDLAAVHTVTQSIVMLNNNDEKFDMFMEFARNLQPDHKIIVFCTTKANANHLSSELAYGKVDAQIIHGDLEQCDREQSLIDISNGTVQILIATDVVSRGIDIDDITHVLNYDFPKNIEEYVHRVGRTGRAGKQGDSISYFTRSDWAHAKELIQILEEANQFVPEELHQMSERFEARKQRDEESGFSRRGGGGGRRNRW